MLTDWHPKSTSVKKHAIRSDPISADPICPSPSLIILLCSYYLIPLIIIIKYIIRCIITPFPLSEGCTPGARANKFNNMFNSNNNIIIIIYHYYPFAPFRRLYSRSTR